ncbi:hypothetical protein TraAM80_07450 [Trypanosoma rangeli]|uniref:Uncharacterized protein n=1 Tax=Trypanosoma rangeli TaxID=5698 RepID=A0A422N5I6_TRYRA|nr:uncharacterized protein TraAM80_07450 [Trypanosoma rangeli]RNF00725.1 hypothetical protein TraAM80_07450 [Trypanosoma rangeli]|eukprot:RNF00725.1 hypothetical protein TraAM80_07450 [Trypanosoma rangeli]
MSARVALSMYRRVLKILASIKCVGAEKLALQRYAEFLPQAMEVTKGESLHVLVRRAFLSANLCPGTLSSGFAFIKDATESMRDLELLALWDAYGRDGEYEMLHGIALVSAALRHAENAEATQLGELAVTVLCIRRQLRQVVEELKGDALVVVAGPSPSSGRRHAWNARLSSLGTAVELLRRRGFEVSERAAEDFTALSLLRRGRASVFLLNVLLTVAFCELGALCTLVGTESHRPWIRFQRDGGRPLFLSFAHTGIHSTKEVMRLNGYPPRSTQWWRAAGWDGSSRKHVLSRLLRMQLMSHSSSADSPLRTQQVRVCQMQIIFLLS